MQEFRREPVTRDHLRALADLKVRADQENLVAPNLATLAQVGFEPGSFAWGLWIGDKPAGLMAMIRPDLHPFPDDRGSDDAAYLWRLMVDANFQGIGLGRYAMDQAEAQARAWQLDFLELTCVPDQPTSALPFYERCGFQQTGVIRHGEAELRKAL